MREMDAQGHCAHYEGLLANKWEGCDDDRGVRLEKVRLDWLHVEEELRLAVR